MQGALCLNSYSFPPADPLLPAAMTSTLQIRKRFTPASEKLSFFTSVDGVAGQNCTLSAQLSPSADFSNYLEAPLASNGPSVFYERIVPIPGSVRGKSRRNQTVFVRSSYTCPGSEPVLSSTLPISLPVRRGSRLTKEGWLKRLAGRLG
jgi:hypothetical protein